MDIEWAKDGGDHRLYIVQARPETVHRAIRPAAVEVFTLMPPAEGPIVTGKAVGEKIGVGPARLMRGRADLRAFQPGEVLVAAMTDPDWEPVMKRAAAIVTDRGGQTCHTAIVSRELGGPCVVGTEHATATIHQGEVVTVSCAQGDTGAVYRGAVPFESASAILAAVTAEAPRHADARLYLGLAQLMRHDVAVAREHLEALRRLPIHPRLAAQLDRVIPLLVTGLDRTVRDLIAARTRRRLRVGRRGGPGAPHVASAPRADVDDPLGAPVGRRALWTAPGPAAVGAVSARVKTRWTESVSAASHASRLG